ncbi:MAG: hypothetical protein N2C14_12520, partial [Planctomycetales bacterium]
DEEPGLSRERAELRTFAWAMEALDQPSRISIFSDNSWIRRAFRENLQHWRENDWQWELHGEMTDIPNADLWKRIDQALCFHEVECRLSRLDQPHFNNEENLLDDGSTRESWTPRSAVQKFRKLLARWKPQTLLGSLAG